MGKDNRYESIRALYQMIPVFTSIARSTFNGKKTGLTRIQRLIISELYIHGKMSMGILARNVRTSNEQAARAAQALYEKGYIIREHEETNRRIINVSISNKALDMIYKAENEYLEVLNDTFKNISDEDMIKMKECTTFMRDLFERVRKENDDRL